MTSKSSETQCNIIINFARSGGTLLNRILATDQKFIVLSEINSRFKCPTVPNSPAEQLREWYKVEIDDGTILEELESCVSIAKSLKKQLFLRDWSFGSFVPLKYNNMCPTQTLNTIDDMSQICPINTVALVRNPIDVWLSMKYSPKTFHDIHLEYLSTYVKDIIRRQIPIVKYEDMTVSPATFTEQLYQILNIKEYTPFHTFVNLSKNVTGDIQFVDESREHNKEIIQPLDRRTLSTADIHFLLYKTQICELLELLNYENTLILQSK